MKSMVLGCVAGGVAGGGLRTTRSVPGSGAGSPDLGRGLQGRGNGLGGMPGGGGALNLAQK